MPLETILIIKQNEKSGRSYCRDWFSHTWVSSRAKLLLHWHPKTNDSKKKKKEKIKALILSSHCPCAVPWGLQWSPCHPSIPVLLQRESFLVTEADILSDWSYQGLVTCARRKCEEDGKGRIWDCQSLAEKAGSAGRQAGVRYGCWIDIQQCLPLPLGTSEHPLGYLTEGTSVPNDSHIQREQQQCLQEAALPRKKGNIKWKLQRCLGGTMVPNGYSWVQHWERLHLYCGNHYPRVAL